MKTILMAATFPVISLLAPGCDSKPNASTRPDEFTRADLVNGGAMYDKWWVVAGIDEPGEDHPLWSQRPDQGSNHRTGADTHRCKECHGWDYKGRDGVYRAGNHRTGFPGILETAKSPQEVFSLLKIEHGFGPLGLNDTALWDLTRFVIEGTINTDEIIDRAGRFTAGLESGEITYDQFCASCHGSDGRTKPYDAIANQPGASPDYDDFPQKIANENPWEFQHKVRFGQPGTDMPRLADRNITPEELASLGAFSQSLDTRGENANTKQ